MKSLFIIRHAKSSWASATEPDFDRPLNDRGKSDAPRMAGRLLSSGIQIDAFISSPAKRARNTARFFVEAYNRPLEDIIYVDQLYQASMAMFPAVIRAIDSSYTSVAIFAHNPGVTDFANSLTATRIDDMPTCSVFAVNVHADDWSGFATAEKEFRFFDYPKSGGIRGKV